jgi:hypothetical protein
MDSGKFIMQESNFFVLVLCKQGRNDGKRLVSVVTVVTVVTVVMKMKMIATVRMMILFASLPPVKNVTNHPRTRDREWIRGGRAQRIKKRFPRSPP